MELFKRLKNFFVGSQVKKQPSAEVAEPGVCMQILNLPNAYIHPKDFMEELSVAIVMDTGKPLQLSSQDLKLYRLGDVKSGKLLGSFYGVIRDGKYYGYYLGSKCIISCQPQAFVFRETEQLIVPLAKVNDTLYVLICHYTCDDGRLFPQRFVELMQDGQEKSVLYRFEQDTTIGAAFNYCKEEIAKL